MQFGRYTVLILAIEMLKDGFKSDYWSPLLTVSASMMSFGERMMMMMMMGETGRISVIE